MLKKVKNNVQQVIKNRKPLPRKRLSKKEAHEITKLKF